MVMNMFMNMVTVTVTITVTVTVMVIGTAIFGVFVVCLIVEVEVFTVARWKCVIYTVEAFTAAPSSKCCTGCSETGYKSECCPRI